MSGRHDKPALVHTPTHPSDSEILQAVTTSSSSSSSSSYQE